MKIIQLAKDHPVIATFVAIIALIIFISIFKGNGSSGVTRQIYSGPSDAAFAADAQIQTAKVNSLGAIQLAQIGAGVQLNSDNKEAETTMFQYTVAKDIALAQSNVEMEQVRAIRDVGLAGESIKAQQIANEAQLTNQAFANLGNLKKKDRDEALQAIVTRQPIASGDSAANSPSGVISAIGGAAGNIAKAFKSIFSDQRLKENIRYLGNDDKGLGVYSFNYKGSNRVYRGRIAQDVKRSMPEAVRVDQKTGFAKVDYIPIGKVTSKPVEREASYVPIRRPNYQGLTDPVSISNII